MSITKDSTNIHYRTGKPLQTANNTLLGVFPVYKVLAYVPNKENGCKVIFFGLQRCKDRKNLYNHAIIPI